MVVFEQVFILFFFGVVGYVLAKTGLVNAAHGKILSALLVYVMLPANIFNTFSARFSIGYLSDNAPFLLVALVALALLVGASLLVSRLLSRDKYEQKIFEYTTVSPNFGYFGYALAASLFGTAFEMMVFTMPMIVYVHTYGFAVLTKSKLNLRGLVNPVTVALLIGAVVGITGVSVPFVLTDITTRAADCMGPVSMLLAGIVVSQYPLRDMFNNRRAFAMSAVRLLALPLIGGLLAAPFTTPAQFSAILLFLSLPCGLNTVVFPKLVDEDCRLGASMAIISNILCCLTIPLVLWIFGVSTV